ncbi:MAG: hypothetical protein A2941_01460 [Candidatus Yanofskybacteria bacterium RIFCSPLOWO2_01_FULL_49_17]|uniref:AAA+ ATPase domain-containing protein n=1 Tax=Candidatus Yanofskybacteria bacterium RIFCSPLOWO2_01_FULL_49_17 TaxID=1802700 RepID=A0A1F8GSK9_9BACT|nr:MAG: hypothetical protein A2941_01460 [Candidatus Yanofskybacteria bacterium RIFCSPLOWO2_01_FULL_49_17]
MIIVIVFAALGLAAFIALSSMRSRGSIARALNMILLSVALPRPLAGDGRRPEKELISVMEQLYSSLTNLHTKGWNKFIYGEPYISLELSVQNIGQEIEFFIAVPRAYKDVFKQQVHGLYPEAEINETEDYNIFHPSGSAMAGYITLKANSILPIRTYQRLESDPLGEILTSMSKLERQGEGAAIQLLIRPSHQDSQKSYAQKVAQEMQRGHGLKDALWRARKRPKEEPLDPSKPQPQKVVTPFEEDVIKGLQAKASKSLFDVNMRMVVSADADDRAKQMLDELAGVLAQFSNGDMNSLSLNKVSGRSLRSLLFNFTFRLFDDSQAMLLSAEELTSLYHFPVNPNVSRVKFLKSKSAEPPANLPNEGIILGRNVFRGQEREVRMTDEDRRRHLYIIGQTGTGKSVTLEALIRQDIEAGHGCCVIDPHGDLADFVASIIPENRVDDVIYFDPAEVSRPMALNMLEYNPRFPEQKTFIVNELLSIFQKLFLAETMGPMFDQYFRNAVLLLLDDSDHEIPTLVHIPRVLTDEAYRRDKLSRETNPLVKNFWEKEAEKAGGEAALANMAPYITSKINGFIANEFLRPILSQPRSSFNFREVMDSQKILIVNLSKGRIGEMNANFIGMMLVGKLLMAALSRVDIPDAERKDFYLYIDEFQNFTTDSIATILSEARKYRLDLIIAHQFIKQLTDKIRDAVFGNVGSIMAFRIGPDDAEFMKNKFEQVFTPHDLMNIDNLNAYVNLLVGGQTTRPFNIKLETERVFGQGHKDYGRQVKDYAIARYAGTSN